MAMLQVLIIFLCAVAYGECGCRDLMGCISPFRTPYEKFLSEGLKPSGFVTNIDDICKKSEDMSTCFDDHESSCNKHVVKAGIKKTIAIRDKLCSDAEKTTLINAESSSCAKKPRSEKTTKEEVEKCELRIVKLGLQDSCKTVEKSNQCFKMEVEDKCGEAYSSIFLFIADALGITLDNSEKPLPPSCQF